MRRALPLAGLAALALGCLRPPIPTVFHRLSPLAVGLPPTERPAKLAVEVLPVRLPDQLQRPQLLLPGPAGPQAHRWANGLERDLQRVLVENLAALLGSEAVVAYPDGEALQAPFQVRLEVHACEGSAAGSLTLRATWMITDRRQGRALAVRKANLQEAFSPGDPASLVAAHDRALLALCRDLASTLRAQVTP